MPQLDLLSIETAILHSGTGKRASILREYISIIEQIPAGKAGRLAAGVGETLGAIRRRLGATAKQFNRTLIIKQTGDYVYFWVDPKSVNRRRGRPSKNTT